MLMKNDWKRMIYIIVEKLKLSIKVILNWFFENNLILYNGLSNWHMYHGSESFFFIGKFSLKNE